MFISKSRWSFDFLGYVQRKVHSKGHAHGLQLRAVLFTTCQILLNHPMKPMCKVLLILYAHMRAYLSWYKTPFLSSKEICVSGRCSCMQGFPYYTFQYHNIGLSFVRCDPKMYLSSFKSRSIQYRDLKPTW